MVRRRRRVVVDDLRERRHLVRQRRRRQGLLHLRVRVRAFFFADAVDVDVPRTQTRGGDLLDLVRDRRAEHQRLAVLRDGSQNLLDRRLEPHVEQPVRLVEHEHPPRRRDQYVAPLIPQVPQVRVEVCPSEHDLCADAVVKRQKRLRLVQDLRRELPGRRQHQHPRPSSPRGAAVARERLDRGEEEPDRLPAAGFRAREDVLPVHDVRQRLVLHRGGELELLHRRDGAQRRVAQAEVFERDRRRRVPGGGGRGGVHRSRGRGFEPRRFARGAARRRERGARGERARAERPRRRDPRARGRRSECGARGLRRRRGGEERRGIARAAERGRAKDAASRRGDAALHRRTQRVRTAPEEARRARGHGDDLRAAR
eukprot:30296-Pelagococcus_subviridis.AAC.2